MDAEKTKTSPEETRREFLTYAGLVAGSLLASAFAPAPPPIATPAPSKTAADTILINGKVITVDAKDTTAQAIAIKDGLIQAVGATAAVRALAGSSTKIIDLGGKTVTPGLVDPHNHLQVFGQMQGYYTPLMPPEIKTLDDLRAKMKQALAKVNEGKWFMGYYLGVTEARLPTRQDLDPVSPVHPVWLVQQGGHYGSANSLALRMAGITAGTKDPSGGVIERDALGEPTGVFYNHRAMDLLRKVIPPFTTDMARKWIADSQAAFAACGVTSFQDNNVRGTDTVKTYLEAGKQGKMILRGAVYYTLEWPEDLNRALKEIERYQDKFMRFAGYKFLLDGQMKMAYCHQPHTGVRWDLPTWEPESFKKAVKALHDTGLQICVHCVGDAAVDLTLDAFEAAMKANPRTDPRHRIEHCVLTTPQATQRIKDLGVVVCTQPQFIRLGGDQYVGLFGAERAKRIMVTREWLKAGIHLALGSDAPTTPWYNPQTTLAAAMSRATPSNKRFEPDQVMTIQEALRAHTMGAAYAGHEEKTKGSIEPGKLADFAVWGADPMTATPTKMLTIPIVMTIIGGKIVYQA
jgi:predicted amidohydrolase YtcJ